MAVQPLKYIDLFAGCGGLSTGLHQAGWKGLFAVERNPMAFSTIKANLIDSRNHFEWPTWLDAKPWDIKDLLAQKADELAALKDKVDLIVGGPPCQGFSTSGRRHENDDRNNLVHSYLELVEIVRPQAIFLENVRGFAMKFKANADAGADYSQMVIQKLRDLGYGDAHGKLLDLAFYGLPQRRKRFIIVATLNGLSQKVFTTLKKRVPRFLAERGIARRNGASAALSDLRFRHGQVPCPDMNGFKSGITSLPRTGLQRYLRVDHDRHTPDSHRYVNHSEEVKTVFKKLLAEAPRNHTILGDERVKYGLKKRGVVVLSAGKPAPTVTSLPDDFVHYSEPRVMTVRECARLQGFPDWFAFKGKYTTGGKDRVLETPRYTQVGNAVPPLFAEMVGLAFKEVLADG